MQEITNRVYLDTTYPGVTLGAINRKHGLILIDSPFRQDDGRNWRSSLYNLGGGVARMLIILDGHMDRTMGAKALDCTITCHNDAAEAFQNRPASIKAQVNDAGAIWEMYNGLGSVRWAAAQLTFSDEINIHWDEDPILLTSKPGIAQGAIWVQIPEDKTIFLGDAVVAKQPPFLGDSHIPSWIEHLKALTAETYQDYFFVGGRNGFVTQEDIHNQIEFLALANDEIMNLPAGKNNADKIETLAEKLLQAIPNLDDQQFALYQARLNWGITNYYKNNFTEK